jgi:hypothetical protein
MSYFKGPGLALPPQVVVSAAGTTTLTNVSDQLVQITGSTTQTVVLPDATTSWNGAWWVIVNNSTGTVTVNFSNATLATTLAAGISATFYVTNSASSTGFAIGG